MSRKNILISGDILAFAILTVIGFATHGEADISYLPRMAAAFFPILFAWFMLAPWFGLFEEQVILTPRSLWRIALMMLFAAPLATSLRAALLGSTALPVFTLVFAASNALGMIAWRWLYIFIAKQSSK